MSNIEISQLTSFYSETPTYIDATYALAKFDQNFQIQIPRESDKNFDIPKITMSYLFSFKFLLFKNQLFKKIIYVCNLGIQPMNNRKIVNLERFKLKSFNLETSVLSCKEPFKVWNFMWVFPTTSNSFQLILTFPTSNGFIRLTVDLSNLNLSNSNNCKLTIFRTKHLSDASNFWRTSETDLKNPSCATNIRQ